MLAGYRRFRRTVYAREKARFDALNHGGQSPRVMVISCSDSRVEPAQIFDTRPGEMFVVRNVAALVPPYQDAPGYHGVSAAVEFATEILGVELIVVLGHGQCGGCSAALHQTMAGHAPGLGGFIADWIAMLDPARAIVAAAHPDIDQPEAQRAMEYAAVRLSLTHLRSFPRVRAREEAGTLRLVGAFFAISDGVLHLMDPASGQFSPGICSDRLQS